jgi:hypothetical protein
MKGKHYIIILVSLTVILLIAAFVSETIYFSDFEYRFRTRKVNSILAEKERIMEDCLSKMKPIQDHNP